MAGPAPYSWIKRERRARNLFRLCCAQSLHDPFGQRGLPRARDCRSAAPPCPAETRAPAARPARWSPPQRPFGYTGTLLHRRGQITEQIGGHQRISRPALRLPTGRPDRADRPPRQRPGPARFGNCASMPAIKPVRMSPVPPVAMAGEPVGLIHTRPSGKAITVRLPFSTRHDLVGPWRTRARCRRDPPGLPRPSCLSGAAISPGCGVSTRSLAAARPAPSRPAHLTHPHRPPSAAPSPHRHARTMATVSGCGAEARADREHVLFWRDASSRPGRALSVINSAAWTGDHRYGGFRRSYCHQARTGAQRSHPAHRRRARLARRSGDDQHVSAFAFVRIRAGAARVDAGTCLGSTSESKIESSVSQSSGGLPIAADAQLAHRIAIRPERLRDLRRGESHGVIGARLLADWIRANRSACPRGCPPPPLWPAESR